MVASHLGKDLSSIKETLFFQRKLQRLSSYTKSLIAHKMISIDLQYHSHSDDHVFQDFFILATPSANFFTAIKATISL